MEMETTDRTNKCFLSFRHVFSLSSRRAGIGSDPRWKVAIERNGQENYDGGDDFNVLATVDNGGNKSNRVGEQTYVHLLCGGHRSDSPSFRFVLIRTRWVVPLPSVPKNNNLPNQLNHLWNNNNQRWRRNKHLANNWNNIHLLSPPFNRLTKKGLKLIPRMIGRWCVTRVIFTPWRIWLPNNISEWLFFCCVLLGEGVCILFLNLPLPLFSLSSSSSFMRPSSLPCRRVTKKSLITKRAIYGNNQLCVSHRMLMRSPLFSPSLFSSVHFPFLSLLTCHPTIFLMEMNPTIPSHNGGRSESIV